MKRIQVQLANTLPQTMQNRIPTDREYERLLTQMEQGIDGQAQMIALTGLKMDYEFLLEIGNGEQKLN